MWYLRAQLYRHFDKNGTLLYIGITTDVLDRTLAHRQTKWFRRMSYITVEHFRTLKAARVAELRALRTEAPAFNKCAYALRSKRER